MCFSATASFSASAVLGIIGLLSLKKVTHHRQLMFASIPVLFAMQQAAEGVQWLHNGSSVCMTHTFLFFAYLVWPIWIPVSLMLVERHYVRQQMLSYLAGIGTAASSFGAYVLLTIGAQVVAGLHHIAYTTPGFNDHFMNFCIGMYGLAVIPPFFISSIKHMRVFGTLILISCIASYVFTYNYFTSVWCFFAALISVCVVWLMKKAQ